MNSKKLNFFLVCASMVIFACTKNVATPSSGTGNSSSSTTITGNFIVAKFTDENSSEDKTSDFTGYTLIFNTINTITVLPITT